MPAPNIETLYKFESYIMAAAETVLNNAGVSSSYVQRDDAELTTPRVELQFALGAANGHVYLSGSKAYQDGFEGNLSALVVTDRFNNSSFHNEFSSKVSALLSDPSNFNSGSNLPYHSVVRSDLVSVSPTINTEDGQDVSGLSFVLSIWIKPTSWL